MAVVSSGPRPVCSSSALDLRSTIVRTPSSPSRWTPADWRWWSASLRYSTAGTRGRTVTHRQPAEVAEIVGAHELDEPRVVFDHDRVSLGTFQGDGATRYSGSVALRIDAARASMVAVDFSPGR